MGFTTPCFIRKNTSELRRKLEELGYEPSRVTFDNEKLCLATAVNRRYTKYTNITSEMFDSVNPHITWNCSGRIDCGTNEELFLSIAALRDDTDKGQWFVYDSRDATVECFRIYDWFICDMDSIKELAFYDCHYSNTHKATVQELIEHFKGDKSEEVTHHIGI